MTSITASLRDDSVATSNKLILGTIALTLLMGSLSSSAVPIAIPMIVREFQDVSHLSWVMAAFLLASTVFAPIFGKLGDRHGRKIILLAAISIFSFGSVLAGMAPSLSILVAARALQGVGSGGLMVISMALIADVVSPANRARTHGLFSWVFAAATIAGPLVGGMIVDALSWRWVFLVNLPLGFLVILVVAITLRDGDRPVLREKGSDYLGATLLMGFLSSVVCVTSLAGADLPWDSPSVPLLIAVALGCLAGFVLVERHKQAAIIPWSLFKLPNFGAVNGLLFFVGVVMFVEITFLPIYLQIVKGMTPTESGLYLLPLLLAVLISSTAGGAIVSRTGRFRMLLGLGMIGLSLGMFGLSTLTHESTIIEICGWMMIVGLGLGPAMSITVPVIQNVVPAEHVGIATAGAGMFRNVGGSVGVSSFGMVFSFFLAGEFGYSLNGASSLSVFQARIASRFPNLEQVSLLFTYQSAIQAVFLLSSVVALAGLLMIVFMRDSEPTSRSMPEVAVPVRS